MSTPFAEISDVEEIYGTVEDEDQDMVTALLRRASTMIRAQVYQPDMRIAQSLLDPQVVTDVCADMVIRVLRNQGGVSQETIGPIATTYNLAVASGQLTLTPEELFILQPPVAARAGVGTIPLTPALSPRHDRRLNREFGSGPRRRFL